MNPKTLAEQINKIAPKFRPDSNDILWLESELDKVAAKALPKLIKKRFAQSLSTTSDLKEVRMPNVTATSIAKPSDSASGAKP